MSSVCPEMIVQEISSFFQQLETFPVDTVDTCVMCVCDLDAASWSMFVPTCVDSCPLQSPWFPKNVHLCWFKHQMKRLSHVVLVKILGCTPFVATMPLVIRLVSPVGSCTGHSSMGHSPKVACQFGSSPASKSSTLIPLVATHGIVHCFSPLFIWLVV